MRRISVLLAVAVVLITAAVGYTYKLRLDQEKRHKTKRSPAIPTIYRALANTGWSWDKDDPQTNKRVVHATASAFRATDSPSVFELRDLALRLYDKKGGTYTYVKCGTARLDEGSGVMNSQGPVLIVMHVPADKDAENPRQIANLIRVETSGIRYETKTGKAETDQPAAFRFSQGGGKGAGVSYDPNKGELHLKSQIGLDWVGKGPVSRKMHVEAGDLVYKEREQKIYLSPWSKLQRQSTTIQAANSLVTLEDGVLHRIDSDRAAGSDVREDKRTDYLADKMVAIFNEDGALVNIVGQGNAKVITTEPASRTTISGERADLRFAVDTKQVGGQPESESNLHLVLADGKAAVRSEPLAQPGAQLAETRILRSEHIELEMKPGGKDVQEIRSPAQAQLEFMPNRPDQAHRVLDTARLRILYGEGSYIDTFQGWKVATHTDKPVSLDKRKTGKAAQRPAPALTWSDEMVAKFQPRSNQVSKIEQTGTFRYQEGVRQATASKAELEQTINRITLLGSARVADDTGSATADKIIMNQANGDMDAIGNVVSTHAPDNNQKPGTSMLDATKTMQARAAQMETREDNTRIFYQGDVTMWQGANRISAQSIDIDRDAETLHAIGGVVSELVDNKAGTDATPSAPPLFTVVRAPELWYRDDTRLAAYTGGVKLTRSQMTVTSKELKAYLTPQSDNKSDDSSLDHAFADGNVQVVDAVAPGRSRTGTGEHCEYYTKLNKVVLNGGRPELVDSYKGVTKGRQLTYFSDDDHLIVEGEKTQLASTHMKKK